ncbi:hypothetical protein AWC38_SpisGene25451 [Stylophora pistillata]|uniref:Uncharacterized protein n=1 Tax=Stylophora pistillata TaxID=50429 RepID=A0A2B4R2N6_STYPI|nr:hypothetical protein AWC38_SpisGene25451 [Stylophora pistillata]
MYTGPQSHYTERTINKREPEWLYDRAKLREEQFRPENSVNEEDDLHEGARELRLFAKESGQGVRQQRVRDNTKEKAGTLPLALSTIRGVRSSQTENAVDTLEEPQALDARQPKRAQIETRPDCDKFLLSRNEEQRLKNFVNGSDEDDYESSGEEESDGDNREDDDDQLTRLEAGRGRSGRRE